MDYPRVSPLDFSRATMGALFNYGFQCAKLGRLWTTVDQALSRADDVLSRGQLDGVSDRKQLQPTTSPLDVPRRSGEQFQAREVLRQHHHR